MKVFWASDWQSGGLFKHDNFLHTVFNTLVFKFRQNLLWLTIWLAITWPIIHLNASLFAYSGRNRPVIPVQTGHFCIVSGTGGRNQTELSQDWPWRIFRKVKRRWIDRNRLFCPFFGGIKSIEIAAFFDINTSLCVVHQKCE